VRRFFTILLTCVAVSCSQPPTTEQRIIAEIQAMEAEVEAGERLNLIGHIAEDFRGQGGAMNREQVRAFVILQLNRYESLQVRLFPVTVEEIGALEASAEFRALLTGGPNWIPESGQVYHFNTFWRLIDDDWRLVAADWEPVALGELMD
jgi:hypothetical protein